MVKPIYCPPGYDPTTEEFPLRKGSCLVYILAFIAICALASGGVAVFVAIFPQTTPPTPKNTTPTPTPTLPPPPPPTLSLTPTQTPTPTQTYTTTPRPPSNPRPRST